MGDSRLDQSQPFVIIPQFLGPCWAHYFEKKFGKQWKPYIVVFFAGYSCAWAGYDASLGCVYDKSVFRVSSEDSNLLFAIECLVSPRRHENTEKTN